MEATKALIKSTGAEIVINVGTAFLNMSVLRACMDTGVAYIDTAIHEEPAKISRGPRRYFELRVEARRRMRGEGHHRHPRRRLRPGRRQRLCQARQGRISRQGDGRRHRRHQRRQPQRVFCHEFRSGDQLPRIHRRRLFLAERPVADQQDVRDRQGIRPADSRQAQGLSAAMTRCIRWPRTWTARTCASGWASATITSTSSPC
ncbi:saccharopine dehydrogenase NADP-binding domain-containing protein [Thauera sp. SDU_THAU2]|uniref:saccharopine dehydrogenase NADP-binding domain-containing protein n=1 Tax=Thauera sp. SDU_THAU2 TaxID=3136633 RepID=UPI00311E8F76